MSNNYVGHVYIPAHIMAMKELTMTQKVLYGKIVGLSQSEGYCFASNAWLSKQLSISSGTVSNYISKFEELGLLTRYVERGKDNEVVKRKLYVYKTSMDTSPSHDGYPPHPQMEDSIENNPREESIKANAKKEKIMERYTNIISWWNKKMSKRYKPTDNNLGNFTYWSDVYEDWEIKAAIMIGYEHDWWHDKINPTRLFRRRSTKGDPIDYIGQLLNYDSDNPRVLRIKQGMQEMESKANDN